ncbi:MAG: hypothetical protein ACTSRZ_10810 [Promethearchaeota archaeon]
MIWKVEHFGTIRTTTKVGIKTDFFKKQKKREIRYNVKKEETISKPKGKRRRPKGVKNIRSKKKKRTPKPKKKRGRKSLFSIFKNGKKGYAKVDPYCCKIRLGGGIPWAVSAGLMDTIELFARKFVQNNVAECINSVISSYFSLTGPKTATSIERSLKAFFLMRNYPNLMDEMAIFHQFHREFSEKQILNFPFLEVMVS